MRKLTEVQKRERQREKARQAFEAVIRDAERLSARIERLFPAALGSSGFGDPAPEVIIGLGQASVYAAEALQLSAFGMDNMLKRFAGRAALADGGRDG